MGKDSKDKGKPAEKAKPAAKKNDEKLKAVANVAKAAADSTAAVLAAEKAKQGKAEAAKPKPLSAAAKAILKNLEGLAFVGGKEERGFWPTGHFNLDFAIVQGSLPVKVDLSKLEGFDPKCPGGVPKGRVVEIYGEPGGGKSSLCLRIVGNAQKMGATCVWFDREQSFVEKLAKINGVDVETLIRIDDAGLSAEQVFHKLFAVIEAGAEVCVVDSVAALIPQRVMENTDPEQQNVALLARVMGANLPKLTSLASKHGCTVIFINQIRQKPGVTYGDPTTTPGGETLKFMASVRLQINKRFGKEAEVYREDEQSGMLRRIAQQSLVFIRKTRYSSGLREGIPVPIYFEPYFPNAEEVAFDLGRQTQVIKVRNGTFSYKTKDDVKVEGEGRSAFIAEVVSRGLLSSLISDIKAEGEAEGIILPPELMLYEDAGEVVKKDTVKPPEQAALESYFEAEHEAGIGEDGAAGSSSGKAGRVRPESLLE